MLQSATWIQTVEFPTPGLYAPWSVPMDHMFTSGVDASGTSTQTSIAVSLTYPAFLTSFFVPVTPPTPLPTPVHVKVAQAGAQSLTATSGMGQVLGGAITGRFTVRTVDHAGGQMTKSMLLPGTTIVRIPLRNGTAGVLTSYVVGPLSLPHFLTADFYGWTPGTVSFMGLTIRGAAQPNVAAMGSFDLTPLGAGTVTLVAPTKLSIDGELNQRRTVSLTTLKLTFVPEPGTTLLFAAAGVALLGLRRRR